MILNRSSYQTCSIKKCVLRNFAKFTWKYLRQSLFLIKMQDLGLQLYQKRDSGTSVFLWILQNFKEQFFYWTPPGDCFCNFKEQKGTFHLSGGAKLDFLGKKIWRNALALKGKYLQGMFRKTFILALSSSIILPLQNRVSNFF